MDKPYIVMESATDWNGNDIAILGRFHVGDKVIVSQEFREIVARTQPTLATQLAGIKIIEHYHRQYTMIYPPRYWESGDAMYTVQGCSWLIHDKDLTPATEADLHKSTLIRINREIKMRFAEYYLDVQPVLQMAVWRELPNQEEPTDKQIVETLERIIARKFGVKVEGEYDD